MKMDFVETSLTHVERLWFKQTYVTSLESKSNGKDKQQSILFNGPFQ